MEKPIKVQNPEMNFKHSTSIQIRFDDIDGMGHVNNTVLLSYFDYAKLQYLNLMYDQLTQKPSVVIVRYEVDFFKPVFLYDKVCVKSSIVHIGNKSLQFVQQICVEEEVHCICKTIMSGFDLENHTSMEIPMDFREKVASFESNPALLK